jgi:hypothetical protein
MLASEKELNLIKMILYPRAIEVILHMLRENGYIRDFKYSSVMAYWVVGLVCIYNWIYEPSNLPSNWVRTVDNYCRLSPGEKMFNYVSEHSTTRIIN